MDFELSEDQLALQEAAADLLDRYAPIDRVREVATTPERIDRALWNAMADQGWLAVDAAAGDGGLGLGFVEAAVLCEQLGRHVAPAPYIGTLLARRALAGQLAADVPSHVATEGVASNSGADAPPPPGLTAALADGSAVGVVAWSSPPHVRAEPLAGGAGGWVLSGRTSPVVFAPVADVLVVPAIQAHGDRGAGSRTALFAADVSAQRPPPLDAMDLTRSLGVFDLDAVPAWRIGDQTAVDVLLDRAVTATCAEMLGGAQRALEMAVEYAKVREQFGRPIGTFQAVKHRCADMLVDVEGMRSATYYAAWCVGAGSGDGPMAASGAKVWCSDASARVMASALQVHGGIGFTWEHDLHLFLKRAQLDQVSYGTARFHRDRLATALSDRVAAGLPVL